MKEGDRLPYLVLMESSIKNPPTFRMQEFSTLCYGLVRYVSQAPRMQMHRSGQSDLFHIFLSLSARAAAFTGQGLGLLLNQSRSETGVIARLRQRCRILERTRFPYRPHYSSHDFIIVFSFLSGGRRLILFSSFTCASLFVYLPACLVPKHVRNYLTFNH